MFRRSPAVNCNRHISDSVRVSPFKNTPGEDLLIEQHFLLLKHDLASKPNKWRRFTIFVVSLALAGSFKSHNSLS